MTIPEFETHMNRLMDCFGDKSYPDTRRKLIWNAVRELDVTWWARTVDGFIGYCRQAPLLDEINARAADEREKLWRQQKRQNEREAKEFYSSAETARAGVQNFIRKIRGVS